jgi:hypothetical protein
MDEISPEFEKQADQLRGLALLNDSDQVSRTLQMFIEETECSEFVGVCYSIGVSIYTYLEMSPDSGFLQFELQASDEMTLPMAFYLNTFLNALIWQNPQLAISTVHSIAHHSKKTRTFFLWKLIVISQALSDMLVSDLQGEVL